jgi:hypothetical protein
MVSAISPASSAIYAHSPYANAARAGGQGEGAHAAASPNGSARSHELDQADQRRVDELKATDRAVRAHEAAHMAAGGNLVTSGATFEYETGPDGQRYAVAGEVGIDTSKGRTPEETLARAEQIRAAALAPADPSSQDRAVAAAAAQMAAEARVEIAQANLAGNSGDTASSPGSDSATATDAASRFGQAIARSLNPSPAGRAVNIYA